MKNIFIITITFILLTFVSCKKASKKIEQNTIESIEISREGTYCFMYIMRNSYKVDGKQVADKDYITVYLTIDKESVKGEYKVIPSKGKENAGAFVGTIKNDVITCIQTYKQNNQLLKEEMVFKIEDNKISILGGEKTMKDGVNMFVDKSKCDYILELPRIECQ